MAVATRPTSTHATLEARLERARAQRDDLRRVEQTGGASYLLGALACAALRLRRALAGGRPG